MWGRRAGVLARASAPTPSGPPRPSPSAAGGAVEVLDDRDVTEAIGGAVERRLRAIEVAPLLSGPSTVAVEGGHHQRMLDGVMKGLGGFLEDNRRTFRVRLDEESPWWVPESIDDRVFEKIYGAVQRFLADVAGDPNHEVRASIDVRVRALAERLRDDPEMIASFEQLKDELISHPEVQAWLGSLWGELKRATRRRRGRSRTASCAAVWSTPSSGPVAAWRPTPSCRPRSTAGSSASSPTWSRTTRARSPA